VNVPTQQMHKYLIEANHLSAKKPSCSHGKLKDRHLVILLDVWDGLLLGLAILGQPNGKLGLARVSVHVHGLYPESVVALRRVVPQDVLDGLLGALALLRIGVDVQEAGAGAGALGVEDVRAGRRLAVQVEIILVCSKSSAVSVTWSSSTHVAGAVED
jgi:hypothetical protein